MPRKSDIPKAREMLREVADKLQSRGDFDTAKYIRAIIENEMTRSSEKKPADPKRRDAALAKAERVRELARTSDLTVSEIAARVGVTTNFVIGALDC